MSGPDWIALFLYFATMAAVGFWFHRRAARDLDSYFLGGRSIHWSLLAMSGAVSNFDITGTMWMVSVLMILGMRSWWHHWMWGVALPAFGLAYMARWVRKSEVMTAAEWMRTRFGEGPGGKAARYSAAALSVLFTAGTVGYAYQGIGKFTAAWLHLENLLPGSALGEWLAAHEAPVMATALLGFTTAYVVVGGLYSVVVTDVIQTVILTGTALLVGWLAWSQAPVIVPEGFTGVAPVWRLESLAGGKHDEYGLFGLLVIVWVMKGVLLNAGGPGQLYDFQRHLAARNARDAAKLAAAWPFFLVVRWAMVMGIALLAFSGSIGADDPERVMPLVLDKYLPSGVRGIAMAGLLAAFMSTFSSTVNSGAAFLVRDLWQPILRPRAGQAELVRAGYAATVIIVAAGILIGSRFDSIGQIWEWLMMALGAAVIVPNVLRWYWWRLNGWGYAAGVAGGILLAVVPLAVDDAPVWQTFPLLCLGSLAAAVGVSCLTAPTPGGVLAEFYRTVKPFGFWGPLRKDEALIRRGIDSPRRALGNTALAVLGLTGLYLAPMYLVGRWYGRASAWGGAFLGCALVLLFTWYRHLPRD